MVICFLFCFPCSSWWHPTFSGSDSLMGHDPNSKYHFWVLTGSSYFDKEALNCSLPNTLASPLPPSYLLSLQVVLGLLALNYLEAHKGFCLRDLLLPSSRSFVSVDSCQSLHPSTMGFSLIFTHPEKPWFLFKFPLEARFERWEVWEKKYLIHMLWKALLAVAHADFPFTRKKRSVLYKNPATAGLVVWDFLWSNRASLMAQERLAVNCSSWLMRRYTMLICWLGLLGGITLNSWSYLSSSVSSSSREGNPGMLAGCWVPTGPHPP